MYQPVSFHLYVYPPSFSKQLCEYVNVDHIRLIEGSVQWWVILNVVQNIKVSLRENAFSVAK